MVDHAQTWERTGSSTPLTDAVLRRMAAYLILEPVGSSLVIAFLVGGVGGNIESFALGGLIGGIASAVLRQRHRDGRL